MEKRDARLLSYQISDGSISRNGETATLVLDAKTRDTDGGDAEIERETVALLREEDNWVMEMSALLSLMVRD